MPRKKSEQDIQFDIQVGARIEAARKAAKFTQRVLAREINVSVQQLYWYEVGRNSCPLVVLIRIAAALRVGVENLIGGGG